MIVRAALSGTIFIRSVTIVFRIAPISRAFGLCIAAPVIVSVSVSVTTLAITITSVISTIAMVVSTMITIPVVAAIAIGWGV